MLTIRDLRVRATSSKGAVHMLRGVDLDIARGRIVGVVGESGSGKSTLASAIIGLLPSNARRTQGEILFAGRDLMSLDEREMRDLRGDRIAMIFQDPMTVLNPVFTVGTQLVDVIRRKSPATRGDAARAEAEALLTRVGIPDPAGRLDCYPHQLSGGMRQRVMIAMALATNAEFILADEPTTALDATVEVQIVTLIRELQRELSGSVLFISHHLGLLAEFCDDVVVMYGGMVMETGPMDEVISEPSHPYTKALLACEIDDAPHGKPLPTIPGALPSPREEPEGCLFASRCPRATEACFRIKPEMAEARPGVSACCLRIGDEE
ncbi:ABC transporter ATP-binding protein [Ensifer sp. 4252]|uniref:ABC transporter ATP-binding protein n=1 Tax=Ensifer sp. 4252 TaxID=3373915 RepID=UPI003D23B10C